MFLRLRQPFLLLFLLIWTLASITVYAAPVPRIIPKAPGVAAKAHILMDFQSGHVITESNSNERRAPASLTKIMTSYVVFSELQQGHIHLDDEVVISEKAWRTGGSKMFTEVGKKISVQDLLDGMVISSGNDASVALAEHIGGAEETFSELMNQYAEILGMENTHFTNSTGMPDENHYTSAKDMAILSQALIRDFPDFYPIYAEKEFTYGKDQRSGKPIKQSNRNKLLWRDDSVDGLKTGYTEAAGYCLAASAKREGMRLISVVLDTKSPEARALETQKLFNFGFRFSGTEKTGDAETPVTTVQIWQGETDQLTVGFDQEIYLTLGKNQLKDLQQVIHTPDKITAPVNKGDHVGSLALTLDSKTVAEYTLVALETIEEGNLWKQVLDSVKLWFE